MSYEVNTSSIKSWAEDDRPREKMMLKGRKALSDAELLAILIGMGTKEYSAVDLGRIILKSVDNNLSKLAQQNISDLKKIKGIGEAKAIAILAAMELGRRRKDADPDQKARLTNSRTAYEFLKPHFLDLRHEEFWIICLNRRQEVLKTIQISVGGVAGTIADPKLIFNQALAHLSSSIILCHNHPSGNLNPSEDDLRLTKKLQEAGEVLDIPVSDHIIFTNDSYFSFADNKLLQ